LLTDQEKHDPARAALIPDVTGSITAGTYHHGEANNQATRTPGHLIPDTASAILASESKGLGHNREDNLISATVTDAWARTGGPAGDEGQNMTITGALTAKGPDGNGAPQVDAGQYVPDAISTLGAQETGSGQHADTQTIVSGGVRRLTPLECERLMGWPDDWTRWAADGSEITDTHRYRMCGNGVVATVAEWLGRQLVAVDASM
jgi:site-specific DNA-cytosine methylase